jgi:formylglycine-generating enzyme required for sulfatase activity
MRRRSFGWAMPAFLLALSLVFSGCENTTGGDKRPPTVTGVSVDAAAGSVKKGGSLQFSATVTGENDPSRAVRWTIETEGAAAGTTIDENGLLSVAAGESLTGLTVKAASVADQTKSGAKTVAVTGDGDADDDDDTDEDDDDELPADRVTLPGDGSLFFTAGLDLAEGTANVAPGAVVGTFPVGNQYSFAANAVKGRDNDRFVLEGNQVKVGDAALETGAWQIYVRAQQGAASFLLGASLYVAETGGPMDFGLTPVEGIILRSVRAEKGKTVGVFGGVAGGSGPYSWILAAGNGVNDYNNGYFDISEDCLRVRTTLPEAGVYRIYARISDRDKKVFQKEFTITVEESFPVPSAANIADEMVTVIAGTTTVTGSSSYVLPYGGTSTFTTFLADRNLTIAPYRMSKYEITWGQWREVAQWAAGHGYTFANTGGPNFDDSSEPNDGTKNIPVVNINWRDAVVWCNALSEYTGKDPVYYVDANKDGVLDGGDTAPMKISSNTEAERSGSGAAMVFTNGFHETDYVVMNKTKNGYRLPVEAEWEFAARGGDVNAPDWMYRWAGTDVFEEVNDYAWTAFNTPGFATLDRKPQPVGMRLPNKLGLHDMSGNVREYCWDWTANAYALTAAMALDGPSNADVAALYYARMVRSTPIMPIFSNASNTIGIGSRNGIGPASPGAKSAPTGFRIVSKY